MRIYNVATGLRNPFPTSQLANRIRRVLDARRDGGCSDAIPMFAGKPLLGHIARGMTDPIALFSDAMRRHGDAVRIPLALHEIVLFNDPQAYERILVRNPNGYGRGFSHRILRAIVGEGMLTASNETWVQTRREAGPRLTPKAVHSMDEIIETHIDRWMRKFDIMARRGEVRPLALDFMCLTSQIAWDVFFGYTMDDQEGRQFVDDFVALQQDTFTRMRLPILPPRPTSFARLWRIERLAKRLRQSPAAGNLAPQTLTLVATAPENPSNTLAWVCYLLGRHPSDAAKIRRELTASGSSEHLTNVIHEALRLYPGGWGYERIALQDDVVAGYEVPKGTCIFLSPYTMHRNPNYWQQPNAFRPQRFAQTRMRDRTPYTYVPFSLGPRTCPGNHYTLKTVTAVLKHLLARYQVVLAPAEMGAMQPLFTLRPKTGILAQLSPV